MAYLNVPPSFAAARGSIGTTPDTISLPATSTFEPTTGQLMLVLVSTPATSTGPAFTAPGPGWVLAGQSVGGTAGGLAVWHKVLTDADVGPFVFGGPGMLAAVAALYDGASGLDGAPVFSTGGSSPAVSGPSFAVTGADRHLVAVATGAWDTSGIGPDGTITLAAARTASTPDRTLHLFGAAGELSPGLTPTYEYPVAGGLWLAASLLIAPPVVPDPPEEEPTAGYAAGVTFSPGEFQPDPVLTVGGVDIANTATRGLPVALDGFTVSWGRSRLLAQPDPATGTVRVFYWSRAAAAAWAAADGRVGQLVTLSYAGELPGEDTVTRAVFYKGRIREVTVTGKTVRLPDGSTISGAVVTLQLASVLTDLSNTTPVGDWPEETFDARRARIQSAAGSLTVQVRDMWLPGQVEAVAGSSQPSVYDHLVGLYDATGTDRLSFRPASVGTDTVVPVVRRDYPGLRGLIGLVADDDTTGDGAGRADLGAYLQPLPAYPAGADPDDPLSPTYIYAPALGYDLDTAGLTLGPDQRITRVEFTNPDGATATLQMPELTRAALAIRDRMVAGAGVDADWTWTGAPSFVGDYAADLIVLYAGDPVDTVLSLVWLNAYIAQHPTTVSYTGRTEVTIVPGANELTEGVRAATARTPLVWNGWADVAAENLIAQVAEEAAAWDLGTVRLSTRYSGGFETVGQARLLLAGAETQDLVFLQRSELPAWGIRPLFGIMGGSIGYADGGWDIDLELAPLAPPDTAQHPVAWNEIDTPARRLVWSDDPHPLGLHESVTWADVRFCAAGLDMTAIPADNGWDD